ncbi:Hypothetical predicted protein [Paramuricea clavata]|uniref:Uncharacterized protein n=1 Tax=Paramuricea clavata TaxID=317549 RepID=A0A7D9EFS9_PARCT|nr:Hypothetical predicted protein [Paramuricea clavata]
MIPLSLILRKEKVGNEFRGKELKINHLLFLDDLKLFGKNKEQVDSLVKTVHIVSKDIGMEFGIKKSGMLVMKRGKIVECNGIQLPDEKTIKSVEEDGYKYLGILELDKIMEGEMKRKFVKEYGRRLRVNSVEPLLQQVAKTGVIGTERCVTKENFKKKAVEEVEKALIDKKMYGQYNRGLGRKVDREKTWWWLKKGELKPET